MATNFPTESITGGFAEVNRTLPDTRWQVWLHAAKERAEYMAQFAPLARSRKPETVFELMPSKPEWLDDIGRVVVQDPPNLITPVDQWALTVASVHTAVAKRSAINGKQHRVTNKRKAA